MRYLLFALALASVSYAQKTGASLHGQRPKSLEIRNAHVLIGDGSPAQGPRSLFVKGGIIVRGPIASPDAVIDGTGCYVLPGLINTHAHVHQSMARVAVKPEYILELWLASGITTVRDNGSAFGASLRLRSRSEKGEIAAPRIMLYRTFGRVDTEERARERVRSYRAAGADGIKLHSNIGYQPEMLAAILTEAQRIGLRVTSHIGVGATNILDYAEGGLTSVEHWYGVPEAALDGVQNFPADFSYSNEVQRFRYSGRVWREADPDKLDSVLQYMVEHGVAWSPTFAVYEASRDLIRAQNKPWFRDYLHPAHEQFFKPSLSSHGSYFIGWSSTDEAYWKENYQIWMRAVRRFAELGGIVTTGEDAGYIYLLYGFGLCRELELHQEAGFHPLEVIRHATYNGARVLGKEKEFGRVVPGLQADLCIVRGNPLKNLKVFYPTGCDEYVDGESVPTGGVQYTIKDGRIYHGETLRKHVRHLVIEARKRAAKKGG